MQQLTVIEKKADECYLVLKGDRSIGRADRNVDLPTQLRVWLKGPNSCVATISACEQRWVVEPVADVEMVCDENDEMIYDEIEDAIRASVLAVLKARESL